MDKSDTSEHDRVTEMKELNSTSSDKAEKERNFWNRAKVLFRNVSLGEYRTPMYFDKKDSYSSATSGILTIMSSLALAYVAYYIFVPIFRMEIYKEDTR
jgi:hypothetical protein